MENIFYVYAYLDSRKPGNFKYGDVIFTFEPFYIGKGHKYRCVHGLTPYRKYENKWHKFKKIKSMSKSGHLPIIQKIYENLSEPDSFKKEIELIKLIGRHDLSTGPLTNHTNGGEGTVNINPEWRKVLSKPIQQFTREGELVAEYDSIKDACKATGLIAQNVGAAANGKYKSSGGFIWKYKNDEDLLQGHITEKVKMPKHSEATKRKMKGRKTSDATKIKMSENSSVKLSVIQVDDNDNHIKTWSSIAEASQSLSIPINKIRRSCQGRFPKIDKQFIWSDPIKQQEAIQTRIKILEFKQRNRIRIRQVKDNVLVKVWDYLTQVREGGFSHQAVTKRCKAGGGEYKGFYWEYE